MRLTVLGRHAPYPPPGGACCGYLIECDAAGGRVSVLVDGGPGVAARVQERVSLADLTAVVVSHLHDDHVSDIYCLHFGAAQAARQGRRAGPLPIYAPLQPADLRQRLEPAWQEGGELRPLPVESELRIGPLRFRFARTEHAVPCWAMRVEEVAPPAEAAARDGSGAAARGVRASLFYSADTNRAAFDRLLPVAHGADLALIEASLPAAEAAEAARFGHCTSADAGRLARLAQVRRLLLTHLWPDLDPEALRREAAAEFPAVELAEERRTYPVGR